jgi:hypothetical protein
MRWREETDGAGWHPRCVSNPHADEGVLRGIVATDKSSRREGGCVTTATTTNTNTSFLCGRCCNRGSCARRGSRKPTQPHAEQVTPRGGGCDSEDDGCARVNEMALGRGKVTEASV